MQKVIAVRPELRESLMQMAKQEPEAYAVIRGTGQNPHIKGFVLFFSLWGGTIVIADITGLPDFNAPCSHRVYGFHVHTGSSCLPDNGSGVPFPLTGDHYDPEKCPHPGHAGDMPPLFGNMGDAFQIFYTRRFLPEEIVGRTVVIHEAPDDFTTQPSGNSGRKMACGEIKSYY